MTTANAFSFIGSQFLFERAIYFYVNSITMTIWVEIRNNDLTGGFTEMHNSDGTPVTYSQWQKWVALIKG